MMNKSQPVSHRGGFLAEAFHSAFIIPHSSL
jgi:hypothetical protein